MPRQLQRRIGEEPRGESGEYTENSSDWVLFLPQPRRGLRLQPHCTLGTNHGTITVFIYLSLQGQGLLFLEIFILSLFWK